MADLFELELPRGPRASPPACTPAEPAGGSLKGGGGSGARRGARQAVVKIVSYRSGAKAVGASLRYIARAEGREPELGVETDAGERLSTRAGLKDLVADWSLAFKPGQRDIMHLVVSFPEGVAEAAARESVRAFLRDIAGDRPWGFALHADTRHLHAHALIVLRDDRGRALRTDPMVLAAWRARLVERAREQGIDLATSTRRARGLDPDRLAVWEAQLLARRETPRPWIEAAREAAETGRLHRRAAARFAAHPEAAARAYEAAGWRLLAAARAAEPAAREHAHAAADRALEAATSFGGRERATELARALRDARPRDLDRER